MTALASGARGFVLALLVFFASAGLAAADPKFLPLTGRVVDNAHILSAATAQQLDTQLADLETKTGRQLVVATVPDLQGYEIEEYGVGLLRAWAIGSKARNDGAILIVAPNEKKVRVEVGYGLEGVLTDALSSVVINSRILPQFKAGHMEQGVVDGAQALIQQLALPDDEAKAQVAQAQARPAARESGGGFPWPVIITVLVVFWLVRGVLGGGRRRRYGGGGGNLWWLLPMILNSRGGGGGGGGWSGGGGFGGGGGGGFSGGGGSGGGGGASGGW